MALDFSRQMQLLRSKIGRFRGLGVYVRDGFRHIDRAVMSVDVVKS